MKKQLKLSPEVIVIKGEAKTTSLKVAEHFGKRHDTVLRSIKNLECSEEFNARNFAVVDYEDAKGEKRPAVEMTKDGFTFLAMGFTGKEAAKWKEAYIKAFNTMERELIRLATQKQNDDWKIARANGRCVRIGLTDTVKAFVEYATDQGSKNAKMYYMNITKMEHKSLFMLDAALKTNLRDQLTACQLGSLITAENIVQRTMREGMASNMHYKDIYAQARQRIEQFASMVGKSAPGTDAPLLTA